MVVTLGRLGTQVWFGGQGTLAALHGIQLGYEEPRGADVEAPNAHHAPAEVDQVSTNWYIP